MHKYSLPPEMLEEIVAGVEMDLRILRYPTFKELRVYCYRVASAVGLVSIEIFGYRNPRCREYAINLGLALQMTNIIRDVWKDFQAGRIYLPQADLAALGLPEFALGAATTSPNPTRQMAIILCSHNSPEIARLSSYCLRAAVK